MSLYGYPRRTTPNLNRFAKEATVFHRHYAGGNFTTPGTASLLTGTFPWSHRALHLHGTTLDNHTNRNVFYLLDEKYYTFAYTHNPLAYILLKHFNAYIDRLTDIRELCTVTNIYADKLFPTDFAIAYQSESLILRHGRHTNASPLLSNLDKQKRLKSLFGPRKTYQQMFPRGLPGYIDRYFPGPLNFTIEQAIDWIQLQLESNKQPFFGYVHLFPPHSPYNTRFDYVDTFDDNWYPESKPEHFFTHGHSEELIQIRRRYYDELLAYADAEFGRLYDNIRQTGILNNTYFIFTSDHGESFERGILEHLTQTLYEPVIRIPLLISKPGQQQRQDVYTPTSCVDLLPTLLHATGHPIPDWCEGQVLPTFCEREGQKDRSIFTIEAKENPKNAPLQKATLAMVKGDHKLIYYTGYEKDYQEKFELYNLQEDPEELVDLFDPTHPIAITLRDELLTKLNEMNQQWL